MSTEKDFIWQARKKEVTQGTKHDWDTLLGRLKIVSAFPIGKKQTQSKRGTGENWWLLGKRENKFLQVKQEQFLQRIDEVISHTLASSSYQRSPWHVWSLSYQQCWNSQGPTATNQHRVFPQLCTTSSWASLPATTRNKRWTRLREEQWCSQGCWLFCKAPRAAHTV